MKGSPPLIKALLLTSLILTFGRGLTLPFLAIFLSQQRGMTPGQTGLVLGTSLMLAIVLSLYGGYLVDRFNKQRLILCAMTCFAVSFFLLPFNAPVILLIVLMGMINFAYSLFSLTLKATLAEWLPVRTLCPASVLRRLQCSCSASLPWHRDDRFPRSVQKPVLRSCCLYAGCRPASNQITAELVTHRPPCTLLTSPVISFRHVISSSLSFLSAILT